MDRVRVLPTEIVHRVSLLFSFGSSLEKIPHILLARHILQIQYRPSTEEPTNLTSPFHSVPVFNFSQHLFEPRTEVLLYGGRECIKRVSVDDLMFSHLSFVSSNIIYHNILLRGDLYSLNSYNLITCPSWVQVSHAPSPRNKDRLSGCVVLNKSRNPV